MAKFLLATQGICQLLSHRMNELACRTADQQHKKKSKIAKVAVHQSKEPSFGYLVIFQVGNLG